MQGTPKAPGQQPVKIYNAVYSSVQVYECMIRGIAVMRRRGDSYVNATQILKVAGVDKGRRTKILEKEILPGKHEIVQGGYGKYQGTWIPLERGRDIATQYGVSPLLAPLFDFTPSTQTGFASIPPKALPLSRPMSASSSSHVNTVQHAPSPYMPANLAPPPILPGSALRLLNQGRAQGLFTPSTSTTGHHSPGPGGYTSPAPYPPPPPPYIYSTQPAFGQPGPIPPAPPPSLKRTHSEAEHDTSRPPSATQYIPSFQSTYEDIQMESTSRPLSAQGPSAAKRPRTEPTPPPVVVAAAKEVEVEDTTLYASRTASKPNASRAFALDPTAPLRDSKRNAVITAICQQDEPGTVLQLLREITPDTPSAGPDIDAVLDDQGHTALHLAASMARLRTVSLLIANGADVHRGNYLGETALVRSCLATHNADQQSLDRLVTSLYDSIRTLDTSGRSVLHHIVSLAGMKARVGAARYYLDQVFFWIAQNQDGNFTSLVDLQDEHGDTALNIAARVGNRSLVRTMLDVGANRALANKLGLRPGDFGVEPEEFATATRSEDLLSSLRSGPSAPVLKSHEVIADMTTMIQTLSTEFVAEIKTKQDVLDVTQAHLRAATRELSEQRKQINVWQGRCGELDQVNQRLRNIDCALVEEDKFDWTGRTDLDGKDARQSAGFAFQWRGQASTTIGPQPAEAVDEGDMDAEAEGDDEPEMPEENDAQTLVRLRRMKMWHSRIEELLTARAKGLAGANAEKEYQCKKIVALCTGIPVDKVEDMLEGLLASMESETPAMEVGRISGFMQKVRDGLI